MKIPIRTSAIAALVLFASAPLALAQRGGGMRAGDSFNERKVAAWRGDAASSRAARCRPARALTGGTRGL